MAFVLVLVGLLMIVTGARGTYGAFGKQLAEDFNGQFLYWIAGIGAVGALGYVDSLRTISRLFMALLLISLVLANGGFFDKFIAALKQGPVAPKGAAGAGAGGGVSSSANVSGSGTGTYGGSTLKESLNKPGGGGAWDFFNIPPAFRPSWAQ